MSLPPNMCAALCGRPAEGCMLLDDEFGRARPYCRACVGGRPHSLAPRPLRVGDKVCRIDDTPNARRSGPPSVVTAIENAHGVLTLTVGKGLAGFVDSMASWRHADGADIDAQATLDIVRVAAERSHEIAPIHIGLPDVTLSAEKLFARGVMDDSSRLRNCRDHHVDIDTYNALLARFQDLEEQTAPWANRAKVLASLDSAVAAAARLETDLNVAREAAIIAKRDKERADDSLRLALDREETREMLYGKVRDERDDLLRENATLRRRAEAAERKAGRR